jgi:Histidine kinase-, DNA gyrase B-, and HSP90-like ATPase
MVDIVPESNIFGIFRNLNYKPWYAIGEFVDNSISSWDAWGSKSLAVQRPKTIRVEIELNTSGSPYLEIRDNSTGIAFEDFDRAFKVASIPPDKSGLNEFGMGMKTAGFWFSNKWSVRTSFAGDSVARTMHFNLEEILRDHLSSIDPVEEASSRDSHYTTIRLENLNQVPKGQTLGKIKAHLTSIYREYLRSGQLELVFNDESLDYEEPEILTAPKAGDTTGPEILWRKEISFELSDGKRVEGFAALRATGSTTYAGFALLRKKRLIEGSSDETFRPSEIFGGSNSYTYQRLFGEFHLNSFNVTHTKDAIKWSDSDREEFIGLLKESLSSEPLNLLQQAEKHRTRTIRPEPVVLEEALNNLRSTLTSGLPEFVDTIPTPSSFLQQPIPEEIEPAGQFAISTELNFDTHNHGSWKVVITGINDEARSNFFEVSAHNEVATRDGRSQNQMSVQLNLSHPFALQFIGPNLENSELLFAFTSSLAIALAIGKSVGARSNFIVTFLNDILRFKGV